MTPLECRETYPDFIRSLEPVKTSICSCGGRSQETYFEISMNEYGYSSGQPLYTTGAGPCLIAVVHDTRRNVGCLAHIYNVVSLLPAVLAYVMLTSIKAMIERIGTTDLTVYLAAGAAFDSRTGHDDDTTKLPFIYDIDFSRLFNGGPGIRYDARYAEVDFPRLLNGLLNDCCPGAAVIDRRNCMVGRGNEISSVVYWPEHSRVLVTDWGRDRRGIEPNRIARSTARGDVGTDDDAIQANRVVRVFDADHAAKEAVLTGDLVLPRADFKIIRSDRCEHFDDDEGGSVICPLCTYPCPACGANADDDDSGVSRSADRRLYVCANILCKRTFNLRPAAPSAAAAASSSASASAATAAPAGPGWTATFDDETGQ